MPAVLGTEEPWHMNGQKILSIVPLLQERAEKLQAELKRQTSPIEVVDNSTVITAHENVSLKNKLKMV
jgi:hypothetical protein